MSHIDNLNYAVNQIRTGAYAAQDSTKTLHMYNSLKKVKKGIENDRSEVAKLKNENGKLKSENKKLKGEK